MSSRGSRCEGKVITQGEVGSLQSVSFEVGRGVVLPQLCHQGWLDGTDNVRVDPWITSDVELGRQRLESLMAQPHMQMCRSERVATERGKELSCGTCLWNLVARRHDGSDLEATLLVRLEAPAEIVSRRLIVELRISAPCVRLPEIERRSDQGYSVRGSHVTREQQDLSGLVRALRQYIGRLEERRPGDVVRTLEATRRSRPPTVVDLVNHGLEEHVHEERYFARRSDLGEKLERSVIRFV